MAAKEIRELFYINIGLSLAFQAVCSLPNVCLNCAFSRRRSCNLPVDNLVSGGGGCCTSGPTALGSGQAYPSWPVRIVVGIPTRRRHAPAPDGSAAAGAARPTIRHREPPGRRQHIATEMVVNAPPDGYTLLLISPAQAVNATLYEKLNYNFIRDIAPVASFSREPNVMVVNVSSGQDGPGVYCLRKVASWPDQHGVGRQRDLGSRGGRAIQDDDRRQHDACPLSRRRPRDDRSAQRPGAGVCSPRCPHRSNMSGPASCEHWR